jgi:hypothetical protein
VTRSPWKPVVCTTRPATDSVLEVLGDDKPVELLARGDDRRVGQLIAEREYPGVS